MRFQFIVYPFFLIFSLIDNHLFTCMQSGNRELHGLQQNFEQIENALVGSWVSENLLQGLKTGNNVENSRQWLKPLRSFTFLRKNGKLNCALEIDFEFIVQEPKQKITIKKINDSIFNILISNPGDESRIWQYNKNDGSIIIESKKEKRMIKYFKFKELKKTTIDPLGYVYNWVLESKYLVKDANNRIISDNVVIKDSKVTNLNSITQMVLTDVGFLLHDKKNHAYFEIVYTEMPKDKKKNSIEKELAYEKKSDIIYLYEYIYADADKNKGLIDSLKLRYILIKK